MTNDPSLMQIGTRNNLLHISEARGADCVYRKPKP